MSWLQVLCYFTLWFGLAELAPLSNLELKKPPSWQKLHLPDAAAENISFPFSVPDMILTEDQKRFIAVESKQGIRFDKFPLSKWPNNEIPYFISNEYNTDERRVIENAIKDFNDRSFLKLKPYSSNDPQVVFIYNGNGCWSYLGRTQNQVQYLSLDRSGCVNTGTVQHEFLHAAGLAHMHNKPDRDDYVTVLWENIPDTWKSQYEKVNSDIFGNQVKYNYYSVMHYPFNAPGTNRPAFDVKDKTVNTAMMGKAPRMTDSDVEMVNTLYPYIMPNSSP